MYEVPTASIGEIWFQRSRYLTPTIFEVEINTLDFGYVYFRTFHVNHEQESCL